MTVDADPVATAIEIDDAQAHSGILRAAVYVASTITDNHLLDMAFQKAPVYTLSLLFLQFHPISLLNFAMTLEIVAVAERHHTCRK